MGEWIGGILPFTGHGFVLVSREQEMTA